MRFPVEKDPQNIIIKILNRNNYEWWKLLKNSGLRLIEKSMPKISGTPIKTNLTNRRYSKKSSKAQYFVLFDKKTYLLHKYFTFSYSIFTYETTIHKTQHFIVHKKALPLFIKIIKNFMFHYNNETIKWQCNFYSLFLYSR